MAGRRRYFSLFIPSEVGLMAGHEFSHRVRESRRIFGGGKKKRKKSLNISGGYDER